MNSVSGIAGSALSAYGIRQAVTANNIANIQTPDFKASKVLLQEKKTGGVDATINTTHDTVEISREATDMISTGRSFQANMKTLQTSDEITRELLSIKA